MFFLNEKNIASCLLNLDHVIIGCFIPNCKGVYVWQLLFLWAVKTLRLIILRLVALLNWVDINFKDSRERHIGRTCTSEPQRELIFSWYLKKHSISIFGYTSPKETITNFQKANIRKYLWNIQFIKFHRNGSDMLLKIKAPWKLLMETSFTNTLCGRRGLKTLWKIKWRRQWS